MYLQLREVPTVVVSSAEAVAEMMKVNNDVLFVNQRTSGTQDMVGSGGKGILFAPYGDHWRQMRKV
jgi:hypothetical protein